MDSGLEHLKSALESGVVDLSDQQIQWHPAGKWSVAEILEHLYLTYTGTTKGFERLMAAGKPLTTHVSMKHRVRTLVVIGFSHMPEGRKAPPQAQPRGLSAETVRNEVGRKLQEMDAMIAQAEVRFGSRTRVLDHPILGPLSAPHWRKFHAVHGWHHHKQILQLRAQMPEMKS
jgi:hypothetical protein